LERVVALKNHLEAKAERGVSDLLLSQGIDFPVDVLARDRRLDPLDAHEILIVERSQSFDRDLEITNLLL
jgi:hypothetical protein